MNGSFSSISFTSSINFLLISSVSSSSSISLNKLISFIVANNLFSSLSVNFFSQVTQKIFNFKTKIFIKAEKN